MGTDRRLARALAVAPVLLLAAAPSTVHAAEPWWQPLAFAGERVSGVVAAPGTLAVDTAQGTFVSHDNGTTFQRATRLPTVAPDSAAERWRIDNGTVLAAPPGGSFAPDPGSPFLGDAAHLIAAPAALPGVAVAVGSDNHVWRRAPSGGWATSFILLPAGGLAGIPRVTAVAAFAQPLTVAVYMGTAGYGVLVSEDGGDDWIRADPGLPENVLGLATDASARALYAATDEGLFVHHLQAFPRPPVYADSQLYLRWLGIALVALAAAAAAVLGLRLVLPR